MASSRPGFLRRHLGSWKILEAGALASCLQPSVPLSSRPHCESLVRVEQELVQTSQAGTRERCHLCSLGPEPPPCAPLVLPAFLSLPQFSFPLQVEYKDFPRNNKNEFVSLINCSSQPPLISHGIGKDVESCHDMVCYPARWAWLQLVAGLRKTGKGFSCRLREQLIVLQVSYF